MLALYALAALTFSFAHKPLDLPRAPDTIELAAYALPDGTLPVLCLAKPDGDQGAPVHVHEACDACALSSAPGLPAAAEDLRLAPLSQRGPQIAIPADACCISNEPENVRSRAPPARPAVKV